ncbi:MAG TPA: hypothetical protein VGD91_20660 [Trebonia sp.]
MISGLDTTATVTVPVLLPPAVLPALVPPELPLLEHAAAVVTATATAAAAASLRFLNVVANLDELINEPPPR